VVRGQGVREVRGWSRGRKLWPFTIEGLRLLGLERLVAATRVCVTRFLPLYMDPGGYPSGN